MVRLAAAEPAREPESMVWDGFMATARRIDEWARDSAGNPRFSYNPNLHTVNQARVLEEYPPQISAAGATLQFGLSSEWVSAPVGSVIVRIGDAEDSPLRVQRPPEVDPLAVLAEPIRKEVA
jgi:hypothetical protein